MRCVTRKEKSYEAMNIKGFNDRDSYTKYKIWITHLNYEIIKYSLIVWGLLYVHRIPKL